MRTLRWFACILVLIAFAGCGTPLDKHSTPPLPSLQESAPTKVRLVESAGELEIDKTKAPSKAPLPNQSRKVIKEGSLEFETKDIGTTRKTIDSTVAELGAYIAKDREYRFSDRIEQKLVIRVPANKFGH